jgi:hypothetical protein
LWIWRSPTSFSHRHLGPGYLFSSILSIKCASTTYMNPFDMLRCEIKMGHMILAINSIEHGSLYILQLLGLTSNINVSSSWLLHSYHRKISRKDFSICFAFIRLHYKLKRNVLTTCNNTILEFVKLYFAWEAQYISIKDPLLVPQESRNVHVHPEGSVMDIHRVSRRILNMSCKLCSKGIFYILRFSCKI